MNARATRALYANRSTAWLWFLVPGIFGALQTWYFYLGDVAEGGSPPFLAPFVNEFTGTYLAALLIWLWLPLLHHHPFDRERWPKSLAVHLVGVVVFSAVHTTLMWGSRSVLFPLVGLGDYDYGRMPVRYFMEFPSQLTGYGLATILINLIRRQRSAHAAEVELTRLERQVAEARLESLRGQLHPHFLFNTLNAVSSVMYEDVERADRVLADLSDLLRRTLDRERRGPEVTLDEELEMLGLYLRIMEARFPDRLRVELDVPEETRACRVPSLLLQPLVENALEHGSPDDPSDPLEVRVAASRHDGSLHLSVSDRGPGLADAAAARGENGGIGLRVTRERLETLYGEGADVRLLPREGGGLRVELSVPWNPSAS